MMGDNVSVLEDYEKCLFLKEIPLLIRNSTEKCWYDGEEFCFVSSWLLEAALEIIADESIKGMQ